MNKNLRQSLLAALTAAIWGLAFVAQSVSTDFMEPFFFVTARSVFACAFLAVLILLRKKGEKRSRAYIKRLLVGGALTGLAFCVAATLQQMGIAGISVGKAGFLTALYIVIVPLLRLFGGKRAAIHTWLSVALAIAGFMLLCLKEDLSIGKDELLVIAGAFIFAVHILLIDHFSTGLDSAEFSFMQFFTAVIVCGCCTAIFETTPVAAIGQAIVPVLYAGIMSSGVAYTLQIAAQKDCDDPVRISIILSLESVFSVVAGALILHEKLPIHELLGCVVIFAAAVLAQLPARGNKESKEVG